MSNGVLIEDVAQFFVGDHTAHNFERGTQLGDHYKCGGCGVQSHMMGDFAHASRSTWRSLETIRVLATNGIFGKQAGKLKPLHNLTVSLFEVSLILLNVSHSLLMT